MKLKSNSLYFFALFVLFAGCGKQNAVTTATPVQPPQQSGVTPVPVVITDKALFVDVAKKAGIRFTLDNGAGGGKYNFIESTPAGCAMIDYDGDGWQDILLIRLGVRMKLQRSVIGHIVLFIITMEMVISLMSRHNQVSIQTSDLHMA